MSKILASGKGKCFREGRLGVGRGGALLALSL